MFVGKTTQSCFHLMEYYFNVVHRSNTDMLLSFKAILIARSAVSLSYHCLMGLVGYMLTFPSSASIRSLHLEGREKEKQQLHGAHNARSLKLTPNEPTAMQPVESERERGRERAE